MADRVFVDTNILVYADDAAAGKKRRQARDVFEDLVAGGRAVVSTQVLQEYFVAATRKLKMSAEDARARVELFNQLDVVLIQPDMIVDAIDLHRLHQLSFWDALIIRSAVAGGCSRLLSEDLHDGGSIAGVRVENPFV